MNCCGTNAQHGEHQGQNAQDLQPSRNWMFWLMLLIILGTLLISFFR